MIVNFIVQESASQVMMLLPAFLAIFFTIFGIWISWVISLREMAGNIYEAFHKATASVRSLCVFMNNLLPQSYNSSEWIYESTHAIVVSLEDLENRLYYMPKWLMRLCPSLKKLQDDPDKFSQFCDTVRNLWGTKEGSVASEDIRDRLPQDIIDEIIALMKSASWELAAAQSYFTSVKLTLCFLGYIEKWTPKK